MSTGPTYYRFDSEPNHSALTFLPTMNDAQVGTIDTVGTQVQRRLEEIRTPAVLVDLSNLSYIGSAMVAVLVKIWKEVKSRGGRMVVVTDHPMVREVLKIAGLEQIWTITPTRETGLDALGVKSRADGSPESSGLGLALAAVGVLVVLVAAAGLGLLLSASPAVPPQVALWIALGGGIVGLIVGSVVAAREAGGRRIVGGLVLLGSLAVLVIALVRLSATLAPNAPQ